MTADLMASWRMLVVAGFAIQVERVEWGHDVAKAVTWGRRPVARVACHAPISIRHDAIKSAVIAHGFTLPASEFLDTKSGRLSRRRAVGRSLPSAVRAPTARGAPDIRRA